MEQKRKRCSTNGMEKNLCTYMKYISELVELRKEYYVLLIFFFLFQVNWHSKLITCKQVEQKFSSS